ncbi:MAG: CBS domain-containing protein [Planctomycetaceae bacterium]
MASERPGGPAGSHGRSIDELLPLIAQAERNDIRRLLAYPEYSAGSIMTTEYASLPADITAGEAINRLRKQSRETIYYVYIVDDQRQLIGFLSLRRLIQAKPQAKLVDLMDSDIIKVRVDADREEVANEISRLTFLAMPVVDDSNRLVGIADDAPRRCCRKRPRKTLRLAAVQPLEDGYLDTAAAGVGLEAWHLAGDPVGNGVRDGDGQLVQPQDPMLRCGGHLDLRVDGDVIDGARQWREWDHVGRPDRSGCSRSRRSVAGWRNCSGSCWCAEIQMGLLLGLTVGGLAFVIGNLWSPRSRRRLWGRRCFSSWDSVR